MDDQGRRDPGDLGHLSGTDLDGATDEEVLAAVRAGHTDAFGVIWRRFERDIRGFVRSLVGSDDVDDVVSETFSKVLRALRGGRGPSDNPLRYLLVTARTTAASAAAAHGRYDQLARRLALGSEQVDPGPEEADELLLSAFRSLHPRWRRALWWSEVMGFSPTELGEKLDLTPQAAAALTYRARRALREAYDQASSRPSEGGSGAGAPAVEQHPEAPGGDDLEGHGDHHHPAGDQAPDQQGT